MMYELFLFTELVASVQMKLLGDGEPSEISVRAIFTICFGPPVKIQTSLFSLKIKMSQFVPLTRMSLQYGVSPLSLDC